MSATAAARSQLDDLRRQRWCHALADRRKALATPPRLVVEGKLSRMVGFTLEAVGCQAPVGAICRVVSPGGIDIEAEVVGFAGDKLFLMPVDAVGGLVQDARVIPTGRVSEALAGNQLLGRVLDGAGRCLDGGRALSGGTFVPLTGRATNPLAREPIREPLDVGIRAINALLTVGRGQRLGLFAGSGVGKSVLLGMMTRFTTADVIVVGLIGERGREVQEFIEDILGEEDRARSVVVAAPADSPPLMRIHGAMHATSIAEYFRAQGKDVLLLMDSLTRFAQAQREIALAIGEPPATRGYTPSVFAKLPQLVERAGNDTRGGGSITAFYTVLTEGDDPQDPIADAARAILDGHIVLSRRLAESGQFPAIDLEASVSRVMSRVVDQEHMDLALKAKRINSTYEQHRDLLSVGAYASGSDPGVEEAIQLFPRLRAFVAQDMGASISLAASVSQLRDLVGEQPVASA
jgi:flagellum-specific ATP synthase